MDATHKFFCEDDLMNPLSSMGMQVSCILVISHFFNLLLKALGQPGPIAQILAGLVLGPSGLSNIEKVKDIFIQRYSANYYEVLSFFCRILFMFLIGLETDIHYIIRNSRVVTILASGGAILGSIIGLSISFYLHSQIGQHTKRVPFTLIMMLIVPYTASPVVVRLAAELKFDTSDIGRTAISSALINEMSCIFIFDLVVSSYIGKVFGGGFLCFFITAIVIFANKYLAVWLNKRNRNQKYLRNPEALFILSLVIGSSIITELSGFNSIINSFIIGLLFPKEGKTARTLLHKLTYSIHNFILPVYFGYIGFQFNVSFFNSLNNMLVIFIMILLSMGSKLGGTLFVCHYLKIPPSEGIFLGFVLNMRGYADLLFIGSASKQIIGFSDTAYNVLLISIVINTIISGIVVGFLRSAKENVFVHDRTTLELLQQEEDELRILACVHEPRHVAPLLAVMAALHGSQTSPISCHLLHLIELVKKSKSNLLYHQKEDHEYSDDEDYGGNDVVQIQEAVDHITSETQILIHHSKVVSSFANLFEDVCNIAEDLRVSTILLPFHKHQRIDGKMESGKEGIRTTNQKVLRHAPCSVGIVVGRGYAGVPGFSQLIGTGGIQNVATLFFGGPDDREAIAWSIRIAKHHRVNLTTIRFLSSSSLQNNQTEDSHEQETEVLMALSSLDQTMNEIDNTFMVDFYNRYVASGQIGYVEKYVCNGVQTVAALKEIGDLYSLFMVGKGGRGNCPLTISLSDWEECPELGTVGDVLASPEFNITGSVVVIQQHRDVRERPSD